LELKLLNQKKQHTKFLSSDEIGCL